MILMFASFLVGCKGQKSSPEKGSGETATPVARAERIRRPAVAGAFYPSDPATLRGQLDSYLEEAEISPGTGDIIALVSPHAGYAYSGRAAGYGFKLLKGRGYDRVIILGPTHYVSFRGASIPAVDYYETPLGKVPLDLRVCRALLKEVLFSTVPQAHGPEHAIEVQLPFLQEVLGDFKAVPVLLGSLSKEDYGQIARAISKHLDSKTLVVASSDFTHYGPNYSYEPFPSDKQTPDRLRELDAGAIEKILQLRPADFQSYVRKTGATICGRKPILLLLHLLTRSSQVVEGRVLEYYTSGHLTNDFTNSVSYAAIAFSYFPPPVARLEPGEQRTLLKLARDAIHRHLEQGGTAPLDLTSYALTPRLREAGAVFVTLRLRGELRGCIGQLQSSQPLYEAVRQRAVAAAVADPRFSALQPRKLQNITVEISVLHPLRRLADWKDVKLGRDGIMIRKGDHGAIFLPEVATEFQYSQPEFWAQLCQKAGLPPDAYREKDAELYAFSTQSFAEPQSSKGHVTDQ